jgi:pimeloyl-ACP methyl ester carboxylesterase
MPSAPSAPSPDTYPLAYTLAGQRGAPPMLLVHGWLSYRGVWQQTLEAFQDSYCCVAVDLLGFGDSPKPADGDYSIMAQGKRILQLADTLGFDRFTLVGHSMGGQVALCVAARLAPARITKVVSVSGVVAGALVPPTARKVYSVVALGRHFPWLYSLASWSFRWNWIARLVFQMWFHNMRAVPFEAWATDRSMAFRPGMCVSAYQAGQAIRLNLIPCLPQITAPALAVFGCQDEVVPVLDGHLVKQHVPNGHLVLIDECGHFPMYEKPQAYLAALRQFLVV